MQHQRHHSAAQHCQIHSIWHGKPLSDLRDRKCAVHLWKFTAFSRCRTLDAGQGLCCQWGGRAEDYIGSQQDSRSLCKLNSGEKTKSRGLCRLYYPCRRLLQWHRAGDRNLCDRDIILCLLVSSSLFSSTLPHLLVTTASYPCFHHIRQFSRSCLHIQDAHLGYSSQSVKTLQPQSIQRMLLIMIFLNLWDVRSVKTVFPWCVVSSLPWWQTCGHELTRTTVITPTACGAVCFFSTVSLLKWLDITLLRLVENIAVAVLSIFIFTLLRTWLHHFFLQVTCPLDTVTGKKKTSYSRLQILLLFKMHMLLEKVHKTHLCCRTSVSYLMTSQIHLLAIQRACSAV